MLSGLPSRTSTTEGTPKATSRRRPQGKWALLFLSPWIVGLLVFTAGPLIASLYLSFTDYDLLSSPQWIGSGNYTRMLTGDPVWRQSVVVTAVYVAVAVPLQLAFALLLATVLNRGIKGMTIWRALYYLPSLFGSSIAIAILWRQIFGAEGLLNNVLGMIGIESTTSWIGDPHWSLGTLILLRVWEFGSPMIIFLAGLRQIPAELYESASLDGAGAVRRFFSITLPMLTPIVFFNLILQVINAFQVFGSAFIIGGGHGGPGNSMLVYTLYLYQAAFNDFQMGYAAAMAWFLLVVIGAVTAVNFWLSRYWVHYSDE
ncbi:carbohydrate ABC transporter permease [Streptomyces rugosispiralis]|uniref:Sugar ABC transporter permease n=1 Tax=Streptomyces rugosispiralis TaxID=2967341 RepID=A0ABT1UYN8_9ACTN|nr:sugar ABC transporter permease [Streptomyces rugosispiralis]MCQ8190254.1 sugar ABC transporter permease [Streptomyces rugosispiralis]